jgi:hypothetical protein
MNGLALLSTDIDPDNTYSTELRNSEIVSHSDAILDMQMCHDWLISCSRDCTVKIWK